MTRLFNKLAFKKNNNNNKINKFGDNSNNIEYIKNSGKSKSQKLFKS